MPDPRYLDGEKGILRYRGYPIEVLAQRSDFVEVSYLLIYGELPTDEEWERFRSSLLRHTMLHEDMRSFYNNERVPRVTPILMATLSSVVGAFSNRPFIKIRSTRTTPGRWKFRCIG